MCCITINGGRALKKLFLLGLSAILLNFSFFYPAYCCWFVYIFLVPILYGVLNRYHVSFYEGLFWGAIYFSLHWHAYIHISLTQEAWLGCLSVYFFLVVYCSFHVGCWFFLASRLARVGAWNRYWVLFSWILSTIGYFYIEKNFIFWIFGIACGYPLGWPLVPLAYYPWLLSLLFFCGEYVIFIFLLIINAIGALFLSEMKFCYFIFGIIFFIPFCIGKLNGFYFDKSPCLVAPLLGYAVPSRRGSNPLDIAQDIGYAVTSCLAKKKDAQIIVMPESSYPFSLNEHPEMIHLWADIMVSEEVYLILGAHRSIHDKAYNCLYCIKNRRIIFYYDKKKLVPLTEYIPTHLKKLPGVADLFLKNKIHFEPRDNKSASTMLQIGNITIVPSICSEFFWGYPLSKKGDIIMCIVNDTWFNSNMRALLCLYARYRALCEKRMIIYVSHYYGILIGETGKIITL